MSNNINSFSQNMNKTVASQANTLAMLTAMQKSMTSNDTFVAYDYEDSEGNIIKYQLPSYDSIVNRLRALEESVNSLNNGKGTINLDDGSRRTISLSSIPHTPAQIVGIDNPSTFTVDSNWFFEDLMFPGATVNINLTGQIEDTADRVRVSRIILNSENDDARTLWNDDLSINNYDYVSLKAVLDANGVAYYEDEETIDMPLVSNRVSGTFQVTEDPALIDDNIWYTLDNITYSTISENGVDQGQNNILSIGDQLSYQDSIFEIIAINQNDFKIRLKRVSGVQEIGVYSMLNYYEDPFRSKVVRVRFGANEYNIIYIKAVAEAYNLLGDQWSTPIKFFSNDLILAGSEGLQEMNYFKFYNQYVKDFGREFINQIYENNKSAWTGQIPNAPTLNGDDFRVVQINTQINAAIDTTDVKNTAAEIESVKSQISSLKSTIAAQKTDLQSAANLYTYNSIQQQITTNTTDLNNLQTTYSTLVESFQTIVRENSAITTAPKYHIRGFFPIPEYKYRDEEGLVEEQIIGFEIGYRYIREDETATQLNTFTYTDNDGVTEITGTFTDWIIERGPMKTKVRNEDYGYVWRSENVADGTETNINQIDIPINKGEKVEIKVRSISEAGYPGNPLMSEWSNSVIIEFPSTLATGNEIADLITMVNDDALNITINNTLQSLGVVTHLDDTTPNTNSVNGMYFKHMAENIAFEENGVTDEGISVVNSISLQKKLEDMNNSVISHESEITRNTNEIASIQTEMKEKHSQYEVSINDLNTGQNVANTSIHQISNKFNTFFDSDKGELFTTKLRLRNQNGTNAISLTSLNQDELFVVNGRSGLDSSLSTVHVHDVYIHPNSMTTSEQVSLMGTINELKAKDADIDSDINDLASNVSQRALSIDLNDVSSRLYNASTAFDEDSNLLHRISGTDGNATYVEAGDLYVGNGRATTLSSAANGELQVKSSNSQYGTVHAKDFMLYTAGTTGSTSKSLSVINNDLVEAQNDIDRLETNFNTLNGEVHAVIAGNDINCVNLYGTDGEFNTMTADKYKTKGTVFAPELANGGGYCEAVFDTLTLNLQTRGKTDIGILIESQYEELTEEIREVDSKFDSKLSSDAYLTVGVIGVNEMRSPKIVIGANKFAADEFVSDDHAEMNFTTLGDIQAINCNKPVFAKDFIVEDGLGKLCTMKDNLAKIKDALTFIHREQVSQSVHNNIIGEILNENGEYIVTTDERLIIKNASIIDSNATFKTINIPEGEAGIQFINSSDGLPSAKIAKGRDNNLTIVGDLTIQGSITFNNDLHINNLTSNKIGLSGNDLESIIRSIKQKINDIISAGKTGNWGNVVEFYNI